MAGKEPVKRKNNTTASQITKSDQYAYVITPLVLAMSDYLAVLCAEQLSFTLRNKLIVNHGELIVPTLIFWVITPLIYIVYLHICESLYHKKPVGCATGFKRTGFVNGCR